MRLYEQTVFENFEANTMVTDGRSCRRRQLLALLARAG